MRDFHYRIRNMLSMKPMASVVIPVFNGALFIVRAMESVLAQTWKDFEIIIVDDGSTEKTQAVLAQMAKTSELICVHQNNTGPAQARNAGIQSAKGEYLAFLGCDDYWFPEKLEAQLAILK